MSHRYELTTGRQKRHRATIKDQSDLIAMLPEEDEESEDDFATAAGENRRENVEVKVNVENEIVDRAAEQQLKNSISMAAFEPFYSPRYFAARPQTNYYVKSRLMKEFTDSRQMENSLYTLLSDFNSGKLRAFGENVTFENMIKVRQQQENLARLHFELNQQQSIKQSTEGDAFDLRGQHAPSKPFSKSNMMRLTQNLQNLCNSIERLQLKNLEDANEFMN